MKSTCFFKLSSAAFCLLSVCTLSARSWQEIRKTGELRVLTADTDREKGLHRITMPIDREQGMLRGFAKKHRLRLVYVKAKDFSSLFPMLLQGKGDIVSANLAETPERKKKYLLSFPFDYTREVVFTSANSKIIGSNPKILQGKTGFLLPGTSYVTHFRSVTAGIPNIKAYVLPSTISHDDLIERVSSGKIEYSVLNECDLDTWLTYRKDIRKLFALQKRIPLVFAAGKNSSQLIRELNIHISELSDSENQDHSFIKKFTDFIQPEKAPEKEPSFPKISHASKADLPTMKKRGFIRILTINDSFCCYLKQGHLCGFEYELAKRFCTSLNTAAVTVIPVEFKDLPKYLAEGKGDIIAANFTRTPEREKLYRNRFTFCSPYGKVKQILVCRRDEPIPSLYALAHRRIFVRRGNAYYDTLMKLKARGIRFQMVLLPENQAEQTTLQKVEQGIYDLTVVDEHHYDLAAACGSKLKKVMDLTEQQSFAWVVRKDNPKLAAAVNAFFRKENKSAFFNISWKKYYEIGKAAKKANLIRIGSKNVISPFDDLFRKYGKMYDFYWCFLAAQSYQESRFHPGTVNHIGATGLMQVMPATAKDLGITNLKDPENGIHAGAKYMAQLRNYLAPEIREVDRLCFTLAAYNAGYGHVKDARKLAARMGLNPNIWFKNTERALALLENSKYAAKAKYGFCRASETIPYVSNIIVQTYHYRKLLEAEANAKAVKMK